MKKEYAVKPKSTFLNSNINRKSCYLYERTYETNAFFDFYMKSLSDVMIENIVYLISSSLRAFC